MNTASASRTGRAGGVLLALLTACSGPDEKKDPAPVENYVRASGEEAETSGEGSDAAKPYVPIQPAEDAAIGEFLADVDYQIRRWSAYVLSANTPEERNKANLLEKNLMRETKKRLPDLIFQLETGPRQNRIVAAAALGFTRAEEAHSPLLAALFDKDQRVIGNALLGLSILERADTPLDRICDVLRHAPSKETRLMAAYAGRTLTENRDAECLVDAARTGIVDEDPGVRSQCVLILGQAADTESIQQIADLLYDEVQLVNAASARALVAIAEASPEHKGAIARLLVRALVALERVPRTRVQNALIQLSDRNYGGDEERWMEWAMRLP
jgi:HEAT repeat protein